jgi:hypothetical protein
MSENCLIPFRRLQEVLIFIPFFNRFTGLQLLHQSVGFQLMAVDSNRIVSSAVSRYKPFSVLFSMGNHKK